MGTQLEAWTGVLVANRGEVAVRVIRAAADLSVRSVAVYSEDDAEALPARRADVSVPLRGRGPAAYLDAEQILDAAMRDGVHRSAPRLRVPERAGELRRRVCRSGPDLRRAFPRGTRGARRQGGSPRDRITLWRAHPARHRGSNQRRRRHRLLRLARRRLHHDQGHRRRRWPGHARGSLTRRPRGRVRALRVRGQGRLRRRPPVRRAARRRSSAHRGAGARRPAGHRRAPRRARLQHPATPPEDRRDRAGTPSSIPGYGTR